jgi:predicted RNA-binding protein associated with RNAse of E/G family
LKKSELTLSDLRFIRTALRRAQVTRTEGDRLWEVVSKVERMIDEQKHNKPAA